MKQLGRQGSFTPRELPRFITTMTPSDSRPCPATVIYSRRWSLVPNAMKPAHTVGSLRFPVDLSTPAVPSHPGLPIRCTCSLLRRMVSGFAASGRLTTTTGLTRPKRVHAFALRLTSSPSRTPTARLPTPPPSRLHGERAIAMVSTFQLTRSTRLSLTNQKQTKATKNSMRLKWAIACSGYSCLSALLLPSERRTSAQRRA